MVQTHRLDIDLVPREIMETLQEIIDFPMKIMRLSCRFSRLNQSIDIYIYYHLYIYTLWLFNIAMENNPLIYIYIYYIYIFMTMTSSIQKAVGAPAFRCLKRSAWGVIGGSQVACSTFTNLSAKS